MIAEALASLSEPHRAVLVEMYFRGRTMGDAAVALGVSPEVVKVRAYYALHTLRVVLEERGVFPTHPFTGDQAVSPDEAFLRGGASSRPGTGVAAR